MVHITTNRDTLDEFVQAVKDGEMNGHIASRDFFQQASNHSLNEARPHSRQYLPYSESQRDKLTTCLNFFILSHADPRLADVDQGKLDGILSIDNPTRPQLFRAKLGRVMGGTRQQYNMWINKPLDGKRGLGFKQLTNPAKRERNVGVLVEAILAYWVSTYIHACMHWCVSLGSMRQCPTLEIECDFN